MKRFSRIFVAGPEHIDELGHVNNAIWVRWMEEVATAHWRAAAPPDHQAAYVWVVTRHEIDYRGNVRAGESVTAQTWVDAPPRGARFDRMIRFTGSDGAIKVDARTTWALIDRATGRLLRVRGAVADLFLRSAEEEEIQQEDDGQGHTQQP